MSIASEICGVSCEACLSITKVLHVTVGRVCSGLVLGVDVDKGIGPVLPHFEFPQVAKGW